MTIATPQTGTGAARLLDSAFELRDGFRPASAQPRVGIFGNGVPETLITASGALPVHLSMGLWAQSAGIDAVVEPFVDAEVRIFLNRLMQGDFADCRGIVFARDDAPALIAYQYATEWVRQGRAATGVPPLFLWNLVHTGTPPVHRFNAIQADKLFDFLATIDLSPPSAETIAQAGAAEASRRDALDRLEAAMGVSLSGATAMRWRNAGRFMSASDHARLLDAALREPGQDAPQGIRLGLVGSPLASPATYDMLETFGSIVCDLQPWGGVWPTSGNDETTLDAILAAAAADPSCPRITPSQAHGATMVEALAAARCDLVVCQIAQTDDTFGWEIPGLAADLAAKGIGFVNLGFRDTEPDDAWHKRAARLIATKLEVRP